MIEGKYVVGFNGKEHVLLKDGVVVYEEDNIVYVGKNYTGQADMIVDAKDKLVSPGFIDTHCDMQPLIKGFMEDGTILERLASDLKIGYTIFYFLINQALSPFIADYAGKLGEIADSSKWLRGYCPICGKEPLIGRLEEETGRRWLFCTLCHTEWLFKRLVCPFCENDDQESLRYFFAEGDESHRIDVCDKCKRYIKTIDYRRMDNIMNLFVETLSTLALDIIADKEGFRGGDISLFRTEQA